jgi:hypothetical protein
MGAASSVNIEQRVSIVTYINPGNPDKLTLLIIQSRQIIIQSRQRESGRIGVPI